jgi:hypothetical protein
VELYPVFDSNEKIVLVHGCALRFISSLIRRSGQFLFFQSHSCPPPTEAIWLGSPSAAGLICAVHKQLLPVLICFSATGLPSPVSCSPCCRKRCPPIDFVLHLRFLFSHREPGCCMVLSAAGSKPEFLSLFRAVCISLLDFVRSPPPMSLVPCFAACGFSSQCCWLCVRTAAS